MAKTIKLHQKLVETLGGSFKYRPLWISEDMLAGGDRKTMEAQADECLKRANELDEFDGNDIVESFHYVIANVTTKAQKNCGWIKEHVAERYTSSVKKSELRDMMEKMEDYTRLVAFTEMKMRNYVEKSIVAKDREHLRRCTADIALRMKELNAQKERLAELEGRSDTLEKNLYVLREATKVLSDLSTQWSLATQFFNDYDVLVGTQWKNAIEYYITNSKVMAKVYGIHNSSTNATEKHATFRVMNRIMVQSFMDSAAFTSRVNEIAVNYVEFSKVHMLAPLSDMHEVITIDSHTSKRKRDTILGKIQKDVDSANEAMNAIINGDATKRLASIKQYQQGIDDLLTKLCDDEKIYSIESSAANSIMKEEGLEDVPFS